MNTTWRRPKFSSGLPATAAQLEFLKKNKVQHRPGILKKEALELISSFLTCKAKQRMHEAAQKQLGKKNEKEK